MNQVNNDFVTNEKDNNTTILETIEQENGSLLQKVHSNFKFFGGISLIFGVSYTTLFYKTMLGFNVLIFTAIMIILLISIIKQLSLKVKGRTISYYVGALLLGASFLFVHSDVLLFFNIIGILLLLDLSLLHQFYEIKEWDFLDYVSKVFLLPFTCISTIGMPFRDAFVFFQNIKILKNKTVRNIVIGLVISMPLLGVIVGLLSHADLLFSRIFSDTFQLIFSFNIFSIIIITIVGFMICYCIICGALSKAGLEEKKKHQFKVDASIAITVLSLLTLVYIIFCSIQILYLFGEGFFQLPSGITFSEYARRGFYELLAVTAINVFLMIISRKYFEDHKVIRILLTLITTCTYIMIGSAAYRMFLYIDVYGLTFLRLLVLLFLLIDFFVLAGVILYVFNSKFPLMHYCVVVMVICYTLFAYARPDYYIAKYQIEHQVEFTIADISYLTEELSLDAAPVVLPFLSELIEEDSLSKQAIKNMKERYLNRINSKKSSRGIRNFTLIQ